MTADFAGGSTSSDGGLALLRAEGGAEVAAHRRVDRDALVVLLNCTALEPVEVVNEPVPFGLEARPGAEVLEFLGKDEREERAENLAARRLAELRNRLLNPPEWVEWLDEPVAAYSRRAVPRDEEAARQLKKRTLTALYNARPP